MGQDPHLASSIDNVAVILDALVHHALRKRRFNRRVVRVHEMVLERCVELDAIAQIGTRPHLDELFHKRRFSCAKIKISIEVRYLF